MNEGLYNKLEAPRRRNDGLRHVPDAAWRKCRSVVDGCSLDDSRADAFKRAFSNTAKIKETKTKKEKTMNRSLITLFIFLCAVACAFAMVGCSNPFAAKPVSPVDLHTERMMSPQGVAERAQATNNFWK